MPQISSADRQLPALLKTFDIEKIASIGADLDRSGFVCLEGVIDKEWLDRARSHVEALLMREGRRFFSIIRPANELNSPAAELVADPSVQGLLEKLSQQARPGGASPDETVYNVLHVVAGGGDDQGILKFHYDASTVTALVPLFIPAGSNTPGSSGELVVYPNKRPYWRTVAGNVVEKLLVQSSWYQRRTARQLLAGNNSELRQLQPGNLYLFWGYRTYHGNFGCASDQLRATMLLHYGSPHGGSGVLRFARNVRRWRETRRLARLAAS